MQQLHRWAASTGYCEIVPPRELLRNSREQRATVFTTPIRTPRPPQLSLGIHPSGLTVLWDSRLPGLVRRWWGVPPARPVPPIRTTAFWVLPPGRTPTAKTTRVWTAPSSPSSEETGPPSAPTSWKSSRRNSRRVIILASRHANVSHRRRLCRRLECRYAENLTSPIRTNCGILKPGLVF